MVLYRFPLVNKLLVMQANQLGFKMCFVFGGWMNERGEWKWVSERKDIQVESCQKNLYETKKKFLQDYEKNIYVRNWKKTFFVFGNSYSFVGWLTMERCQFWFPSLFFKGRIKVIYRGHFVFNIFLYLLEKG